MKDHQHDLVNGGVLTIVGFILLCQPPILFLLGLAMCIVGGALVGRGLAKARHQR